MNPVGKVKNLFIKCVDSSGNGTVQYLWVERKEVAASRREIFFGLFDFAKLAKLCCNTNK